MRGLDPRIHLLEINVREMMDGRVKPGHDEAFQPSGFTNLGSR
jgi:hypothetical protein